MNNHESEVTGNLVASRNSENSGVLKLKAKFGHIIFIHHITGKRTSHGESLFDRTTNLRSKSNG